LKAKTKEHLLDFTIFGQMQVHPTDFDTLILAYLSQREPETELGTELAYCDQISEMEAITCLEQHFGNTTASYRVDGLER
jgi:hypothetical protein